MAQQYHAGGSDFQGQLIAIVVKFDQLQGLSFGAIHAQSTAHGVEENTAPPRWAA